MLTVIFHALCDHLRTLGLPCYLADCVPQGAVLPYLTAELQPPLHPDAQGSMTLSCWCAGEKSNDRRFALANQVEAAFPHRGLWLATDAGVLIITHDGALQCITQHGVQGVVFRFRLKLFPTT